MDYLFKKVYVMYPNFFGDKYYGESQVVILEGTITNTTLDHIIVSIDSCSIPLTLPKDNSLKSTKWSFDRDELKLYILLNYGVDAL